LHVALVRPDIVEDLLAGERLARVAQEALQQVPLGRRQVERALAAVGGAGGILGAVIAPLLQRRLSFGQAIISACWCYALVWALLPAAATPALLMILIGVASFISLTYDTVQMSYRLTLIPDALQGRVNSVFRLVADGMKALGVAATGILLEWLGTTSTILVSTGVLAVLAVLTLLNHHVRTAPPQTATTTS
jgi:predicted MFS family arabinose efflux permease